MHQFFKILILFVFLSVTFNETKAELYLVKDGQATSAIVIETDSPVTQMAARELQYHVERASGAKLQLLSPKQAQSLPAEQVRIIIGNGETADALGANAEKFPVDTYIVKTQQNILLFSGHDTPIVERAHQSGDWNAATVWAVSHFLEEQLNVLWLWPGEIGTYVPLQKTIVLPNLDIRNQPPLEQRMLPNTLYRRSREGSPPILSEDEVRKVQGEAHDWQRRFRLGSRSEARFGHAFGDWWEKYHEKEPKLFAVPPPESEYKMPWPVPKRVKLNISNEAVDEKIIAEWQAAGAPDIWNVSPNDSTGFDTTPDTRAMDDPQSTDLEAIWRGRTNLTARYVKFWNRLVGKMKKINPNVILTTYAYSVYREPPIPPLELDPAVTLQYVPADYWAYESWEAWQRNGSKIFLRPNWWHAGAVAPVLPLHAQGNFFKFATKNNMQGFYFDTMNGHWATQGAMYYTIARLSVHPEISVDQIIEEYCLAFAGAAPVIKEYLGYWEEHTTTLYPAGGIDGLFAQTAQKYGFPNTGTVGSYPAFRYLYDDDILDPAYAILDRASRTVEPNQDDGYANERIKFLRKGLDHLKLTRDVLRLGYKKRLTPEEQSTYLTLSKELAEKRRNWTVEHVLWGEMQNWYEARYGIPTVPGRARAKIEREEDA